VSWRRSARRATAAVAFTSAAVSFAFGLGGQSGSWLLAMVISLAMLTLGFFVASGSSSGGAPAAPPSGGPSDKSR